MVLRTSPLFLAALFFLPVAETAKAQQKAETLPEWIEYIVDKPGSFRRKAPLRTIDPVPALSEDEIKKLQAEPTDELCQELFSAFLDRAEETYKRLGNPPEGMLYWLRDHQELREAFLVALSPFYDNLQGAMKVLNTLRLAEP